MHGQCDRKPDLSERSLKHGPRLDAKINADQKGPSVEFFRSHVRGVSKASAWIRRSEGGETPIEGPDLHSDTPRLNITTSTGAAPTVGVIWCSFFTLCAGNISPDGCSDTAIGVLSVS